jgi:hypothetical protein
MAAAMVEALAWRRLVSAVMVPANSFVCREFCVKYGLLCELWVQGVDRFGHTLSHYYYYIRRMFCSF